MTVRPLMIAFIEMLASKRSSRVCNAIRSALLRFDARCFAAQSQPVEVPRTVLQALQTYPKLRVAKVSIWERRCMIRIE